MNNGGGSEEQLLPRLCCPEKGPNGYGFHLHGEKGKVGQYIRLVEPDSPAEKSGLRAGDRLVEVNGENVEKESHQQVVNRIRGSPGSVRLLVVDAETDERLQKLGLECREELVRALPREKAEEEEEKEKPSQQEAAPQEPQKADAEEKNHVAPRNELRPRLCQMKKGSNGYGFNLHSDKTKPGQYIRAVDPDSPAESSGLQPQDRIIEVNGQCMEGKQHSDVVTAIRSGGDETKLLVVDTLTDEFFKKCKVIPSEAHLTGPLPEPVANGDVEKVKTVPSTQFIADILLDPLQKLQNSFHVDSFVIMSAGKMPLTVLLDRCRGYITHATKDNSRNEQPELLSESPSSLEAVSVSSSLSESNNELNSQEKEEEKRSSVPDPVLDLDIPLAVAKERAHQKRTSKRAPQMDWSKKNELFSNL